MSAPYSRHCILPPDTVSEAGGDRKTFLQVDAQHPDPASDATIFMNRSKKDIGWN
jgi:hypothetical protein